MAEAFTILIVDDESDISESIAEVLAVALPGATVVSAADGREGIDILDKQNIHLILSDYKMPNMDGIEFLTYAHEKYPDIPRLLLTAFPDPALAARAVKEAKVGLFLAKPFDVTYLVEVLKAFAPE